MTDDTPKPGPVQPDWSKAYALTHAEYEQQARDFVDAQSAHLAKQKEPGYIIPGFESFVMANLPKNDPKAQRLKWRMINGDAPFPGDEVKS